jgi:hypothetical protein
MDYCRVFIFKNLRKKELDKSMEESDDFLAGLDPLPDFEVSAK